MDRIKVAYICHFSTPSIRESLSLKSLWLSNVLRKLKGISRLDYGDSATWNADFITTFENNDEYDCYVISHHFGMKKSEQCFDKNGVHYMFINEQQDGLFYKIRKNIIKRYKINRFVGDGKRIGRIVEDINPDVVVVCGAENALYSSSVLYIHHKPIFIILQTLANSPKRKEMGMGNDEWRAFERKVLLKAQYFGTFNKDEADYLEELKGQAFSLKILFPSLPPIFEGKVEKDCDFVFFANGLFKYKGIEDALKGFAQVCKKYCRATMVVIGACDDAYKKVLDELVEKEGIKDKVTFMKHFPFKSDVIKQVQKAKVAVLPGITAPLNSTVRETMYLGVPTVVYETSITKVINQKQMCLLEAEMENAEDLGNKMIYAYEHPMEMAEMAKRAKEYAEEHFSSKAVAKMLDNNVKAVVNHFYNNKQIPEELLLK